MIENDQDIEKYFTIAIKWKATGNIVEQSSWFPIEFNLLQFNIKS